MPVDQRIATFDNDGTLWSEQPMYVQALSRSTASRRCAAAIPNGKTGSRSSRSWTATCAALAALGEKGLLEIIDRDA